MRIRHALAILVLLAPSQALFAEDTPWKELPAALEAAKHENKMSLVYVYDGV